MNVLTQLKEKMVTMRNKSINSLEERQQIKAVEKNPLEIEFIKNPSEYVQMAAVKKSHGCITLIDSPTEKVQRYVAEIDPFSVSLYPSSEEARLIAIEHDPGVIAHIEKPSSALCRAALEKVFPGMAMDSGFTAVETKILIEKVKHIENIEARMKVFDRFKLDIAEEKNIRIKAIQILEGNSPERIFDEQFTSIHTQFPTERGNLSDAINDIESGITYHEPRMLSDEHFKKKEIYESAQHFANKIKESLTPEEVVTFSNELESPLNLPLGQAPTIEEALSLFQNEYVDRFRTALYENEKEGRYDVGKPIIEYQNKSEELLLAGTYPYSPNYKEVFDKAGLINEFKTFEEACCKRRQWEGNYYYYTQASDIAEMSDLERQLPSLNDKIESSRMLIYNKLSNLSHQKKMDEPENDMKRIKAVLEDIKQDWSEGVNKYFYEDPKLLESVLGRYGLQTIFDEIHKQSNLYRGGSEEEMYNAKIELDVLEEKLQIVCSEGIKQLEIEEKSRKKPEQAINDTISEQLNKLGVNQEQQKYIQELLRYGKTSDLVSIKANVLGQEIAAQVRLSIKLECENPEIKLHFIRKDLKEDLKQPFMGHSFSSTQKENLITCSHAGEQIPILNEKGQRVMVLVSVDGLTRELIATPIERIVIPGQIRGVQLNEDQRQILLSGKTLHLTGIKNEGISYGISLQYSVDKGKVISLPNSNKITIIAGATLSEDQSESLRNGETVQVAGLIDDKGEKYSAFVKIGYPKENLIITPTNEHRIQVRHNNQGEKIEKNKYSVNSVIKSGESDAKRKGQRKRFI